MPRPELALWSEHVTGTCVKLMCALSDDNDWPWKAGHKGQNFWWIFISTIVPCDPEPLTNYSLTHSLTQTDQIW